MSNLLNIASFLLAIFGAVLAVGIAIDSGVTDKGRERLKNTAFWKWLMTARPVEGQKQPNFLQSIQEFHGSVLASTFDSSVTSKRFIFRSFFFSIILMITILLISLIINDNPLSDYAIFNYEKYPFYSLAAVIIAIMVTVFLDYFSFAQTMIFFSFARNSNSNWSLVWLSVGDLIISANIFAFFFPVCLIGLTFMASQLSEKVQLKTFVSRTELRQDAFGKELIEERFRDDKFILNNSEYFVSEVSKKIYIIQFALFKSDKPSIHVVTPVPALVSAGLDSRLNLADPELDKALSKLSRTNMSNDLIYAEELDRSEQRRVTYDLRVDFKPRLQELKRLYALAFVLSNNVRTGFLGMTNLDPSVIRIDPLLSHIYSERWQSEQGGNDSSLICFLGGDFHDVHLSPRTLPVGYDNCNQWLYVSGDIRGVVRQSYSAIGHPRVAVPLSIFFLPSFGITIFIYISVLTYHLFRLAIWSSHRLKRSATGPFRDGYINVDRVAFSLVAGCIAIALNMILLVFLVTLWAFGYT